MCTPTTFGGGVHLTLGYAGCGGDTPQPVPGCNVVILVRKKDGSLHFCMDFHRPIAHMKQDLENMAGTIHFSTMDFKSGFWQVKMVPESQQYTTFTMGNLGFMSLLVCPLGSVMPP